MISKVALELITSYSSNQKLEMYKNAIRSNSEIFHLIRNRLDVMKSALIDDFLIENRYTGRRRKLVERFRAVRILVGDRFFRSGDRRIDLEIAELRRSFDHVDDVFGRHLGPDRHSQIVLSDGDGSALFNEQRTVGGNFQRLPKCFRVNVEGQEALGLGWIANGSSTALFVDLKI